MKRIIVTLTVTLALVAAPLAAQSSRDSLVKKDMAALQGQWSMLWGEMDGQRTTSGPLAGAKRTAVGDESTVVIGGQLFMKAKFTVDPTKNPHTIDYLMTGGATTGKTQLGIYRISGDTVQFCFAEPGVARPTAMTTTAGSQRTCSAWRRDK